MHPQTFSVCIEACQACANACDRCAAACLREDDPKSMVDCIAMDMDCAQICRLASAFMSRDSVHSAAVCTLCADICDACGQVCSQHQMDHCQACAVACKRCADDCRRMAAMSTQNS